MHSPALPPPLPAYVVQEVRQIRQFCRLMKPSDTLLIAHSTNDSGETELNVFCVVGEDGHREITVERPPDMQDAQKVYDEVIR